VTEIARRTLREWFAYLDSTERELTLTEFMAVMLFNQREYTRVLLEEVRQVRQAAEHTEGMLGALYLLASTVAASSGVPYAGSGEVRAALDAARDETRRLAAAARSEPR
jgi:hypothetical protein